MERGKRERSPAFTKSSSKVLFEFLLVVVVVVVVVLLW